MATAAKGFLQRWEERAPLTEEQREYVRILATAVEERPIPQEGAVEEESEAGGPGRPDGSVRAEKGELRSVHQFYEWFLSLEATMEEEKEEKYTSYIDSLRAYLQCCDEIVEEADSALRDLGELERQHVLVSGKTSALHDACENLVNEKTRLMDLADNIRSRLSYFDELDRASAQLNAPTMSVSSEYFVPLLKRLDECMDYINEHPHYRDSDSFLRRFRELQAKGLSLIRAHVVETLKSTTTQVLQQTKTLAHTDSLEASVLYVRFRAIAQPLQKIIGEIEKRTGTKENLDLLQECYSCYFQQRSLLLSGAARAHIQSLAQEHDLVFLTRFGCAYLIQVCQQEYSLFHQFFASTAEGDGLSAFLESICGVLYDTLRPLIIQIVDLEKLCELCDVTNSEVLEEQIERRGPSVSAFDPIVRRILQDLQERLIFRSQTFIRDEIRGYRPSGDDLAYPEKLEAHAETPNSTPTETEDGASHLSSRSQSIYATWYPPLTRTLKLLAQIYRCVDISIFEGLAHEAVSECTHCFLQASKLMARNKSPVDGFLFLIKHLLILREQIAPFDIDFAVTEKTLDFTMMINSFSQLLRGQTSVLSFNNYNTLLNFVWHAAPRIIDSYLDSKKDLEKEFKSACESFIAYITRATVGGLAELLSRVSSSNGQTDEVSHMDTRIPTVEELKTILKEIEQCMETELPALVRKMSIYLNNPVTQGILFKPIRANIVHTFWELHRMLASAYSPEERGQLAAASPDEIAHRLELLSC